MRCVFQTGDNVRVCVVNMDAIPMKGDSIYAAEELYEVTGVAYDLDQTPVVAIIRIALRSRKRQRNSV